MPPAAAPAAAPAVAPQYRVVDAHSGNRTGAERHPDTGGMQPDRDVDAAREATPGRGGWQGAHDNFRETDGRRKKLRSTPGSKTVLIPGKGAVTVYKGTSSVEDERWVYIREVKDNGTKARTLCHSPAIIYHS